MDKKIFLLISLLLIFGVSFVWVQAKFENNSSPLFSRLLASFFKQSVPVTDQPESSSDNERSASPKSDRSLFFNHADVTEFCRKDSDCLPLPGGERGACVYDDNPTCPFRGKCAYPGACTRGPIVYCDIHTGRIIRALNGQYCPVADSQGSELWTTDSRNCSNLHDRYKKCGVGDSQCPSCGPGTVLDSKTNKCVPEKKCVVSGCSGQFCTEEGEERISTCEWRPEYACFEKSECGRQANGQCGWSPKVERCLGSFGDGTR